MQIKLNQIYSRADIAKELGGSSRVFAPFSARRVLCLCLDTDKNPNAPTVLLPKGGTLRERMIEYVVNSISGLPVFIKRGNKQWEYVGDYGFDRISRKKSDIRNEHQGSTNDINSIVAVIYMKKRALADKVRPGE